MWWASSPNAGIDNTLVRQFDVAAPDKAGVTDITNTKAH